MVADKGKKQKVEEDGISSIDKDLLLSIENLQAIQDELEKINEEASDKVLEVEQKYSEIRKPVYQKRNEIIQSIPDFWLTALSSHPVIGGLLTEEDQKIFKFLTSIEVEDSKNVKYGYTITFNFKPNPYFEDTKLFKSYTFQEDGTTKVTATTIKWKEGMAIQNGDANPNEKKGKKRPPQEESFFSWFTDTQHKDEDFCDIHDEIAELFKEDIWPDPLSYFNNQGAEDEEFEVDDEEDCDGSEDDEEQDGEDDDDDGDDDDEE